MYAIVEASGRQLKVSEGERVKVPKLNILPGEEYIMDKVLLLSTSKGVVVGSPYIKETQVSAEILSHGWGEKITVFKFKRRKNYRRKVGHRSEYTQLLVKKISPPKKDQ